VNIPSVEQYFPAKHDLLTPASQYVPLSHSVALPGIASIAPPAILLYPFVTVPSLIVDPDSIPFVQTPAPSVLHSASVVAISTDSVLVPLGHGDLV
jgi:hypothetical protein